MSACDEEDAELARQFSLPPDERSVMRVVHGEVTITFTGTKAEEEGQLLELAALVETNFPGATVATIDGEVVRFHA